MNSLVSIRTNITYSKKEKKTTKEKDIFIRHQELIFLVDKPSYRYSNEGNIIRERSIEEFRFVVSDEGFENLTKILERYKTIEPNQLK